MLIEWIRLIQNGSDSSLQNQKEDSTSMDGSTVLHIGKKAPFNNFFMWMDVPNIDIVDMSVDYYNGKEWIPVVDLLDDTNGARQTGVVQFSPNKKNKWTQVSDTSDYPSSGLSALTIYDMYWLRVTFSGDLSAGTTLKRVAYKFTDEYHLKQYDTDINEFLPSFGQTNWLPQILNASVETAKELKKRNLIRDEGQVLRFEDVAIPCALKAIFNIYLNLGDSYKERRKDIDKLFTASFDGIYTIDKDNDAVVSKQEVANSTSVVSR